jgi:hypothetical protein
MAVVTFEQRGNAELEAEDARLLATVGDLRATVERLSAEVAALKAQMGKGSTNLSLPPWRDDLALARAARSVVPRNARPVASPASSPGLPGRR